MSEAFSLLPGVVFHGRYRVVRCIRRGGMGAVFEVLDERTDSRRALKVMHPDLVDDDDLRGRFAQEARVTGAVESDHVVRISDGAVDESTGTPFLVMDLLRGSDLAGLLHDTGRLSPRDVVTYLGQAALGLDRAHAAGIVHRDLKPENLFLTRRDDGSPCVKVLDFGIAKLIARRTQARDTRAMGTPTYMAPEQIRGEGTIGPAADVYALGLIAYALLVGQDYWREEVERAGSMFSFFSRVVQGMPEPPAARAARTRGVTLGEAFDAWLLRATAPRPEDRFAGAGAAVAALADALGVETPPGLSRVSMTVETQAQASDLDGGQPTRSIREPTPANATTRATSADPGVDAQTPATGVDTLQHETLAATGGAHDTVPASAWGHTATSVSPTPPRHEVTTGGAPPHPPPPAVAEVVSLASGPQTFSVPAVPAEVPSRRPLPRLVLGSLGAAAVAAVIAWVALTSPALHSAGTAAASRAVAATPAGDPPSTPPPPVPTGDPPGASPSPAPSGEAVKAPIPRPDAAKPHPPAAHSAGSPKPMPSATPSGLPGLF